MQKVKKSHRAALRNLSVLGAAAASAFMSSQQAQATWIGTFNGGAQAGATSDYNNPSNWAGSTIDDTFGPGALQLVTTTHGTSPSTTVAGSTIYFSGNRSTSGAAGVTYTTGPYGLDSFTIGTNGFVDASVVAGTNTTTATLTLAGGSTDGPKANSYTLTLNGDIADIASSMNGTIVEVAQLNFTDAIFPDTSTGLNINLNGATRTIYSGTSTSNHSANSIVFGASTGSGGVISDSTGSTTSGIIKDGDGRVFIQSVETYSGPTTVGLTANFGGGANAATGLGTSSSYGLELQGASGAIVNSSEFNVNAYESLQVLDRGGSDRSNRLSHSAPLNLFSGSFGTTGAGGAAFTFSGYANGTFTETVSETIGSLNFDSNIGIVNTGIALSGTNGALTTSSTMILTAGSLGRSNGALGVFANISSNHILLGTNGSQKNMVLFTTAPAMIGGTSLTPTLTNQAIIPWLSSGDTAIGGNVTFLTYDGTNGLTPLQTTNYYSGTLAANPDATNNIRVTTADTSLSTSSATVTMNSLNLTKNVTLGTNGATLAITSGAILISAASNVTGGTLAFGSAEGIINTRGAATTITSNITGSGGLTAGGSSAASFTHVGALGYTGTTNIVGAGASFSSSTIPTTSPVIVQPGALLDIGAGTSGTPNNQIVASLSGGSYLVQGRVNLGATTFTSLNLGTSTGATANTVTMNSTSTFISPGLAGSLANDASNTSARIGSLQIANVGTAASTTTTASNLQLLNGGVDIDLASNPSSRGGLGLPSNDLIEVTGNTKLANGGNLNLAVSAIGGYTPTVVGTQWTILVAGDTTTRDIVTDSNIGTSSKLFDSVTSGYTATIGNYGTGTNNAVILTYTGAGGTTAPTISLTAGASTNLFKGSSIPISGNVANDSSATDNYNYTVAGAAGPADGTVTITSGASSAGLAPGSSNSYSGTFTATAAGTTAVTTTSTGSSGTSTNVYATSAALNVNVFDHGVPLLSTGGTTLNLGRVTQEQNIGSTAFSIVNTAPGGGSNATTGNIDVTAASGTSGTTFSYSVGTGTNLVAGGSGDGGSASYVSGTTAATGTSTPAGTTVGSFNLTYADAVAQGYVGARSAFTTINIAASVDALVEDTTTLGSTGVAATDGTAAYRQQLTHGNVGTVTVVKAASGYTPGYADNINGGAGVSAGTLTINVTGSGTGFNPDSSVILLDLSGITAASGATAGLTALESNLSSLGYDYVDRFGNTDDSLSTGILNTFRTSSRDYDLELLFSSSSSPASSPSYFDFDLSNANYSGIGQVVNIAVVPEPASLSVLGIGMLGLIARRRRDRKAS